MEDLSTFAFDNLLTRLRPKAEEIQRTVAFKTVSNMILKCSFLSALENWHCFFWYLSMNVSYIYNDLINIDQIHMLLIST